MIKWEIKITPTSKSNYNGRRKKKKDFQMKTLKNRIKVKTKQTDDG
jgi:hypothetical protein